MIIYDNRQSNKFERKLNGIQAYKIISVNNGEIEFELPKSFGKGKTGSVILKDKFIPEEHVPGNYIDLILRYTIHEGKSSSYTATYIGLTPPQFTPKKLINEKRRFGNE